MPIWTSIKTRSSTRCSFSNTSRGIKKRKRRADARRLRSVRCGLELDTGEPELVVGLLGSRDEFAKVLEVFFAAFDGGGEPKAKLRVALPLEAAPDIVHGITRFAVDRERVGALEQIFFTDVLQLD